MSLRAMVAVLESDLRGTKKLACLSLANHSDDNGENCWPSMATISREASCSESQARRQVHKLMATGLVEVKAGTQHGGRQTPRYRIRLDRLTPSTHATPRTGATPSKRDSGAPSAGASPALAQPQGQPSHRCEPNSHRTVNERKAEGARGTRLPADWTPSDSLKAWAGEERPDLNVDEQAAKFRDHWIAEPGKKGVKLDWDATFRNWLRNERQRGGNGSGKPIKHVCGFCPAPATGDVGGIHCCSAHTNDAMDRKPRINRSAK